MLCVVLGLLIWKKEKVSLIHDYHYKNVQEADIPAYARLMGIGIILIGVGICIAGILNERNAAETLIRAVFVHLDNDIWTARTFNRDNTINLLPIHNTIINERENQDALDPISELAIDANSLTGRIGTSAIITIKLNVRRIVEIAESIA